MKRWLKRIFYIPKHSKPTDENILRLLLPSAVGIALCMVCLAGSTWAWFTASVQTQPQTIAAANFDISAALTTEDGTPIAPGKPLQAGQAYTVTLTASGTAAEFGGYCMVEGDDKSRYTEQLLPDKTLTFTLIPEKDGIYTFTGVWGEYSGEADITDGCTIGEKPKTPQPAPEATEPQQFPADESVYTVQSGDSLWKIAQQYGTTVEKITAYNDIDRNAVLQIGQKIKIPLADYEIPEKSAPASSQQGESQPSGDEPDQGESASIPSGTSVPKSESSTPSE